MARIRVHTAVLDPAFVDFAVVYAELWNERLLRESIIDRAYLSTDVTISRHMLRHLPTMLEDEIVEVTSRAALSNIVKYFGIPKDEVFFRLCEDLSTTKHAFTRPQPMMIPPFHTFIIEALEFQGGYLLQEDAKSYFHQFEMPEHARPLFGGLLGDERGHFVPVRMRVLSMGFHKSPSYGQRFSNGICNYTKTAIRTKSALPTRINPWIDNFIMSSPTVGQAVMARDTFRAACSTFGVTLKRTDLEPAQEMTCLSVLLDTRLRTFALSPKFTENLTTTVQTVPMNTPRGAFQWIGRLLWGAFVLRVPLAAFPEVVGYMSRTCRPTDTDIQWDAAQPLTSAEKADIRALVEEITRNTPRHASQLTMDWDTVTAAWSDASGILGAWVIDEMGGADPEWSTFGWDQTMRNAHIFYKELVSLQMAAAALCHRCQQSQILLLTDNTAVGFAVSKGHSTNPFTNDIINDIYQKCSASKNTLFVHWVSTKINRADALTRLATIPGPRIDIAQLDITRRRVITAIPRQGIQAS